MRRPVNAPYTITTEFGVPDSYAKFGYHYLHRLWYTVTMKEQWLDIQGFAGLYQISNGGRLRRLPVAGRSRNTKVISYPRGSLNTKGYLVYKLYTLDGRTKTLPAHRLVAQSFLINKDALPQVNHKDGNKLNNHTTNLEWITNLDNMRHAIATGLVDVRGEASGMNKYPEEKIREILEHPTNRGYRALSEKTGIPYFYVKAVRSGTRWNWLWSEYNA